MKDQDLEKMIIRKNKDMTPSQDHVGLVGWDMVDQDLKHEINWIILYVYQEIKHEEDQLMVHGEY